MDNIIEQNIVLAKMNEVLDMEVFLLEKKVKLQKELDKLKQLESKKDE